MMYQIDNEKFGKFISELRKEKNLTQKELAEKLYVSDKTISKWERGGSIPNVVLLIPIAETLGTTVTELLKGERIHTDINKKDVENIVVQSLDLSVKDIIKRHRKQWIIAYLIFFIIILIEMILLILSHIPYKYILEVFYICMIMMIFGVWVCIFARELPAYYDNNKINYVTQGIFRIHMSGLSFNNSNWIYILYVFRIFTLSISILSPIFLYLCFMISGLNLWLNVRIYAIWIVIALLFISIYYVGKKYE